MIEQPRDLHAAENSAYAPSLACNRVSQRGYRRNPAHRRVSFAQGAFGYLLNMQARVGGHQRARPAIRPVGRDGELGRVRASSSNRSARFCITVPPNSSASTSVTARR